MVGWPMRGRKGEDRRSNDLCEAGRDLAPKRHRRAEECVEQYGECLLGDRKQQHQYRENMNFEEVRALRNERLGQKMIKHLKQRHFDAYYCKDTSELLDRVRELIPEGSSVSCGGSVSIRDTGVLDMLRVGNYNFSDRDAATTPEEKRRIALDAMDCDFYLASANAISEDGVIVNIDGTGNRVAACTWGPRHVIYVVGLNKVCQDVDAAIKRARSTAAPINATRFGLQAPCQTDGICHDCKSPGCICSFISIQRMSFPEGRHIVVLVGEKLGF